MKLVDWSDYSRLPMAKVERDTEIIVTHNATFRLKASRDWQRDSGANCFGDVTYCRVFMSEDEKHMMFFRLPEDPKQRETWSVYSGPIPVLKKPGLLGS